MPTRSTLLYAFYAFIILYVLVYGLPNVDLTSATASCTIKNTSRLKNIAAQDEFSSESLLCLDKAQKLSSDSKIPYSELEATSTINEEKVHAEKESLLLTSPSENHETILSNPLAALEAKLEELKIGRKRDRQKISNAKLIRKLAWSEYGMSKRSYMDRLKLLSQERRSDIIDREILQSQIRMERIEADIRLLKDGKPIIKEEVEYWLYSE